MNRFLFVSVIAAAFVFPLSVQAAPEEEYRTALREIALLLTRQVEALTAELEAVRGVRAASAERGRTQSAAARRLHENEFYSGPYAAIYTVRGSDLVPAFGRPERVHEHVFAIFRAVAGRNFVETHIAEFRVYDNADAEIGAFIDQIGVSDRWILGVNMVDVELDSPRGAAFLRDLLIHEIGHVVIHGDPEARRVFAQRFWNDDDREHARRVEESDDPYGVTLPYYRTNRSRFVSEYATRDPLEDMAESFMYYVTRGTHGLTGTAQEKVRFFERYTVFRDARDGIRGRLGR